MTDQRERIRDHVLTHPGLHFSELRRRLDLASGQLQHHLRTLRDRDQVVAEERDGRTHYFAPDVGSDRRDAIAVLRRETARDVLFCLLERGPSPPATVADDIGIARSTLEWHLERLVDQELVEKRRDARNRVTLAVVDRDRAVGLLAAITPSLSDRMVDRFTRLVDNLLTE